MRRIVLIVTALGALVAAGAAIAATSQINTYKINMKFSPKKAGSTHKPAPVGFTLDIKASGTNGNRTAVLEDLKTSIYGLRVDGKDFPTCTTAQIGAAQNDTGCPKAARVATGYITASLGSANNFQASGQACDPVLDVWNAGQGKLTFFFVDTPTHQCLGGALHTGQVGPWSATYKTHGKYLVVDVPIPSYVDFPVPGLAGSLETEHLVWAKHTAKVHGHTVSSFSSVGCTKGKRPYSETFKANLPSSSGSGGVTQTKTLKHTAAC